MTTLYHTGLWQAAGQQNGRWGEVLPAERAPPLSLLPLQESAEDKCRAQKPTTADLNCVYYCIYLKPTIKSSPTLFMYTSCAPFKHIMLIYTYRSVPTKHMALALLEE